MDIIHPAIEAYVDSLLPPRPSIFHEMEEKARKENFPAVGAAVGNLLELLARSINAQRILELGSGFGYSGLWFARALPPDGKIILTDFDNTNRTTALENFKKAGFAHLMEFKSGDARDILKELEGPFDIVFNDIDKEYYPQVIEPVYHILRQGGLFITDNSLWYGRVIKKENENNTKADAPTQAVREFNERIRNHPGFQAAIIPLRDGLTVSIKR